VREKWIFIARSHGLEIEDTPKPRDEVGKPLEEFQKEKDLQRNRVYTLLSALTVGNIYFLRNREIFCTEAKIYVIIILYEYRL